MARLREVEGDRAVDGAAADRARVRRRTDGRGARMAQAAVLAGQSHDGPARVLAGHAIEVRRNGVRREVRQRQHGRLTNDLVAIIFGEHGKGLDAATGLRDCDHVLWIRDREVLQRTLGLLLGVIAAALLNLDERPFKVARCCLFLEMLQRSKPSPKSAPTSAASSAPT